MFGKNKKNITIHKNEEFLNNEVRYNSLKLKNKEYAESLLEQQKNNAIERYEYYKNLI